MKEFLLHVYKTLVHKYNHSQVQTNSPRGNMLKNQNNFSSKSNSFIPQIDNDLATPTTYDPDLKTSIQPSHNNTEKLKLFNKSSAVDFTIDEIFIELGNDS